MYTCLNWNPKTYPDVAGQFLRETFSMISVIGNFDDTDIIIINTHALVYIYFYFS